jgi:hypothetical protein
MEKRLVKLGLDTLPKRMTMAQAQRYGDRVMPLSLKLAAFRTTIFVSDLDINGGVFYRINWVK